MLCNFTEKEKRNKGNVEDENQVENILSFENEKNISIFSCRQKGILVRDKRETGVMKCSAPCKF